MVDRSYLDGRFDEFEWGLQTVCPDTRVFLRSRAADALEAARREDPASWDPSPGGWRFLLKCKTDSELLAVSGIGRRRLRAIRSLAPHYHWVNEPDGTPHRDRLRPPPPKGRHPWWLLP